MNVPQVAPVSKAARTRRSSDSVWPLRRDDGSLLCDPPKSHNKKDSANNE